MSPRKNIRIKLSLREGSDVRWYINFNCRPIKPRAHFPNDDNNKKKNSQHDHFIHPKLPKINNC